MLSLAVSMSVTCMAPFLEWKNMAKYAQLKYFQKEYSGVCVCNKIVFVVCCERKNNKLKADKRIGKSRAR